MLARLKAAIRGDGHATAIFMPQRVFVVLFFVNLLNYCDRGIIPGSTNEFSQFVQSSLDTSTPDVYIGILQSSFIVGFAVASIIFGHLVHYYSPFFLCGIGMSIWCLAVVSSGLALTFNSYSFLVLARCLSGVGESSMQCSIPPWIEAKAGAGAKASWLGLFYCAIPVGTAFGYTYSALISASIGARFAFFIEFFLMAPFILFLFAASVRYPEIASIASASSGAGSGGGAGAGNRANSSSSSSGGGGGGGGGDRKSLSINEARPRSQSSSSATAAAAAAPSAAAYALTRPPTMKQELLNVFSSPIFVCIVLGYAAQTGSLIGISTFGSPILMGLGFFQSETEASTTFGALVSVAGVVGSLGGGILLDARTKATALAYTERLRLQGEAAGLGGLGGVEGVEGGIGAGVGAGADAGTDTGASEAGSGSNSSFSPLIPQTATTSPAAAAATAAAVGATKAAGSDALVEAVVNSLYLQQACRMVWLCSVGGCACLWSVFLIDSKALFLMVVCFGCICVFFTTPGINLAIMKAVGPRHRSFAIAMCNLLIHALGDVPSPVITGLLKDKLAPDCAGVDASSSQCRQDGEGLRLTFFLVTLWLAWTVVFFGLALLLAGRTLRRNKRQVNSFGFGGGDSRLLLLGGPGEGNDDDDDGDEDGGGMGGDEDFVDVLSEPLLPRAGRGPGGEGEDDGEAAGRSSTYIL